MRGSVRRVLAATAFAASVGLAGAGSAHAAGVDLGPDPQICNAYAPTANCFYAAVSGTDTFTLGSHILHVGDTMSGVYSWSIGGQGGGEYPSYGSVSAETGGPGLKLMHCHGRLHASNQLATWGTPRAFDVTKGQTTCEWKAVSVTDQWSVALALSVYAGGETYPAGDYYAVVSKGSVIEGDVREENIQDLVAAYTGIPGATVRVTGPRGFSKKVVTSGSGYYNVFVPRAGVYTVTPVLPAKYWKGGKSKAVEPSFSKVNVPDDKTVRANFTVPSSLRLRVSLSRPSVSADGLSYVDATVTATNDGEPDPSLPFSLRPFGGGSALQSAWEMPVPATICTLSGASVGGRVWPKPYQTPLNTNSVDLTSGPTGTSSFRIFTGTVPGKIPVTVWAEDGAGHLIAKDANNTSDSVDLDVTPLASTGGDPTGDLKSYLQAHAGAAGTLSTYNTTIVNQLALAVQSGALKGYVLNPVQAPSGGAVLISPAGARAPLDLTSGQIKSTASGWIIAPNQKLGTSVAADGFWGLLQTGYATLPTVSAWLSNNAPGYAFPYNTPQSPITPTTGLSSLEYFGFSYLPACA